MSDPAIWPSFLVVMKFVPKLWVVPSWLQPMYIRCIPEDFHTETQDFQWLYIIPIPIYIYIYVYIYIYIIYIYDYIYFPLQRHLLRNHVLRFHVHCFSGSATGLWPQTELEHYVILDYDYYKILLTIISHIMYIYIYIHMICMYVCIYVSRDIIHDMYMHI